MIVSSAQLLPPLTQPSEPLVIKGAHRSAAQFDPANYCETQLSGVDCFCFAQKSAQILSKPNERVIGFKYVNPVDLAIKQGRDGCS